METTKKQAPADREVNDNIAKENEKTGTAEEEACFRAVTWNVRRKTYDEVVEIASIARNNLVDVVGLQEAGWWKAPEGEETEFKLVKDKGGGATAMWRC